MTQPIQATGPAAQILASAGQALGLATPQSRLHITQPATLDSCFPVADLAVAAIGTAGLAVADLLAALPGSSEPQAPIIINQRSLVRWFASSITPIGWQIQAAWDAIAGDYPTRDGWIRLHTNAPHHRAAALEILRVAPNRESVAAATFQWLSDELESAIIAAGGCAARMRSQADWSTHPQGRAVAAEKLIAIERIEPRGTPAPLTAWQPDAARPLRGIRVLDLTRILAGPVATRFLAGLGATVLRLDPPDWDEPSLAPDVTLGKYCARLDLRDAAGRDHFRDLLGKADILIHGYRPGALDRLGLTANTRQRINPALIDISLCAWGWTGPWAGRRGFDSLVQMAAGIAEAGMRWRQADRPVPLPVQAIDHATGYLMAAAALRGLTLRLRSQTAFTARLSLARTAASLVDATRQSNPAIADHPASDDSAIPDYSDTVEQTAWGPARRLRSPIQIGDVTLHWDRPASPLGSAPPDWPD